MPWKIALQKIMTTKFKILFFILLIAVLLGGFYYKDNIWGIYNNVGKNLQNFEKTDLGNIINEFKKEVFTPSPLNIGGGGKKKKFFYKKKKKNITKKY